MGKSAKIIFSFALVALLTMPFLAMAEYQPQDVTFDPNDEIREGSRLGNTSPVAATASVINWALGILGLFFLVLLIYGGFTWMTASGNEEKTGKAKKIIMAAVIGVVIILSSYGVSYYLFENVINATSR